MRIAHATRHAAQSTRRFGYFHRRRSTLNLLSTNTRCGCCFISLPLIVSASHPLLLFFFSFHLVLLYLILICCCNRRCDATHMKGHDSMQASSVLPSRGFAVCAARVPCVVYAFGRWNEFNGWYSQCLDKHKSLISSRESCSRDPREREERELMEKDTHSEWLHVIRYTI